MKRKLIAAAVLLASAYLRFTMPEASEEMLAGARAVLDEKQAVLILPDRVFEWLDLG